MLLNLHRVYPFEMQ